jgi:hypothetical protein
LSPFSANQRDRVYLCPANPVNIYGDILTSQGTPLTELEAILQQCTV